MKRIETPEEAIEYLGLPIVEGQKTGNIILALAKKIQQLDQRLRLLERKNKIASFRKRKPNARTSF